MDHKHQTGDNILILIEKDRKSTKNRWVKKLACRRKKLLWFLSTKGSKFSKRLIDIVLSLFLMALFSPIFLLSGLCIKLADKGPIFFVTNRVGHLGNEFRFPKFRSMFIDAEKRKEALLADNQHTSGPTFKIRDDPRATWIGRFLRKTSLDELPQLWCVLMGQMSLVGPRPPLPEEVEQYSLEERKRLDVKPGLTCIWQVSGRSELPFPIQCQLDIQYIENQSLWLDLQLLCKTIPVVLLGKGAY